MTEAEKFKIRLLISDLEKSRENYEKNNARNFNERLVILRLLDIINEHPAT